MLTGAQSLVVGCREGYSSRRRSNAGIPKEETNLHLMNTKRSFKYPDGYEWSVWALETWFLKLISGFKSPSWPCELDPQQSLLDPTRPFRLSYKPNLTGTPLPWREARRLWGPSGSGGLSQAPFSWHHCSLPPSRPSWPPFRMSSPSTCELTSRSLLWAAAFVSSSWAFQWSLK